MPKKRIFLVMVLAVAAVLAAISLYYWYNSVLYVATDDARVYGPLYKVSAGASSRIAEIRAEEGDSVQAGQVLARLDDTLLPPAASADLALVRAPAAGVVVKRIANPGEMAAPGQPLLMLVDSQGLYVTANIEEGKVERLKPGQAVDVYLDSLAGRAFTGVLTQIGQATQATFSLLPPTSTGNNFIKVTQRVPVRISVPSAQAGGFVYGANASVRIHVR